MATPYFKTKSFKTLKNLLFGVGAAVVIVGAWAKILHLPFANIMLTVGLLTEAVIFAISGINSTRTRLLLGKILSRFGSIMIQKLSVQHAAPVSASASNKKSLISRNG
jgi:hypothetical protein